MRRIPLAHSTNKLKITVNNHLVGAKHFVFEMLRPVNFVFEMLSPYRNNKRNNQ
jgi:hypothetical protein